MLIVFIVCITVELLRSVLTALKSDYFTTVILDLVVLAVTKKEHWAEPYTTLVKVGVS